MNVDLGLTLQVLTLVVAAGGPLVAYRYAKRLFLSGNRQAWLDALREDVAELIAVADSISLLFGQVARAKGVARKNELGTVLRDKAERIQAIRHRVRLRLRSGNPKHDKLLGAIKALVAGGKKLQKDRHALRDDVVVAAEAVLQHVWAQIEKGK